MKVISVDLGQELSSVRIIPLSDMHIGDGHVNIKKLQETIDYIKTHDDVYTIVNGDNIDNAVRNSVSDIYGGVMNPMDSLEKLYEMLLPIRKKILVMTTGNHEARTYKQTGIDVTRNIAWRLGLEDNYAPENYVLFVSFGQPHTTRETRRYTYSLHGTHGSGGGGRLVGGKLNALERLAGNIDADIYLHSHTHVPATFKLDFIRTDTRTRTIRQVTKMFVNTNAWMNYGGYGEVFNFKPSTISPVVIKLEPKNGELYSSCEV